MVFHDYDEGLDYAKEVNKPLMLDFTRKRQKPSKTHIAIIIGEKKVSVDLEIVSKKAES